MNAGDTMGVTHSVRDTADKVDVQGIADVAKFSADFVLEFDRSE